MASTSGAAPDTDAMTSRGTDAASTGETTAVDDTTGEPEATVPKSLVVAIDGLRPDALLAANTPHLDGVLLGGWLEGYGVAYTGQAQALTDAATLSGPNHWAIMTGAIGAQHGVTGNGDVGSGDGVAFPHYLSLLEAADPSLNTAYLFTWPTDVLVPCDADLVTGGDDATNSDRVAGILAGVYDDPQWPAGTDPDAVFIFLDDVDGAGHASGFDPANPAYLAQIEEIDAQVGGMLDAIASRPTLAAEDWQVVVTTDHGGIGQSHGGMTPQELTIPFGVTSRTTRQGALPPGTEAGGTRNFDTVPTVLTHFDVTVPGALTGTPR
jgi:predicted AlkP superfamily pyrophosphatase or phosphodiesterase